MKKEDLVVGKVYLMSGHTLVYFCGFNKEGNAIVEPLNKNVGAKILKDELEYCGWKSKGSGFYWRYPSLEKGLQEVKKPYSVFIDTLEIF